jgi:hypothetical protein
MKHKHADLIHAWADGAEIQWKSKDDGKWIDSDLPDWVPEYEYRIKPEEKKPVVRWLWADLSGGGFRITQWFYTETELGNTNAIKLEWSRTEFPE